MNNIIVFADNYVGLECTLFLINNYIKDIVYVVVTNEKSIVYKRLKTTSLNKEKIIFNEDFDSKKSDSVDYIFLLWWPNLIEENVISLANKGVVNTHPSLLPHNRGKNYNFWNLVEDVPFGVSLHFVDSGIDSGDIIFQREICKSWEDTGESLYHTSQLEMVSLFKENYKKIVNSTFSRIKQDLKKGSYHNAKEMNAASEIFLDKEYTARNLLNLLRARTFHPYDSCYFYEDNDKYEIQIKIKKVDK